MANNFAASSTDEQNTFGRSSFTGLTAFKFFVPSTFGFKKYQVHWVRGIREMSRVPIEQIHNFFALKTLHLSCNFLYH